ncbi:MAG: phenylacetate--CoA ligase family protein [Deltaproteobacteria bacterium]
MIDMNHPDAITEIRSRADLERYQSARLAALLAEILPRNRFWRAKFAAAGVTPADIQTPQDLRRLPFATKAEILADQAAHPPYGTNLTYDFSQYSRLHQTSGTTGVPLRWLDTPQSWEAILGNWRQLFGLMGLRRDDRLFFPFSFGPFLGFWAGFEGANRLGNLCIAAGGMSSPARLNLLLENRATIVCCTPTYALRLAEVAAEQKINLPASPVRAILVAGEPGGNIPATRRRIEAAWGGQVVDHWGMTELGPLAIESLDEPGGLYVLETECIAEIIDPLTSQPVPTGTEGELVITNLGRLGSPLIRYRTGDRVRGRTGSEPPPPAPALRRGGGTAVDPSLAGITPSFPPFIRGGPGGTRQDVFAAAAQLRPHVLFLPGGILGRTDEMITIRGNNLYPSALEDVIRQFDGVAEFRIELQTVKAMQHIKIEIEPVPALGVSAVEQLVAQIGDMIRARWNFQAEIVAVKTGSLPRFEMKGRRFIRA